ncbi:MAG: hypothetical protein PHS62_00180 [Patescibacteria group bacterium]|nr:hypothetical protein [Patescibacteria group bacterium]
MKNNSFQVLECVVGHEQGAANIRVSVDNKTWWVGVNCASSWVAAARDSLHAVLAGFYPGLRKAAIPRGPRISREQAWSMIQESYGRQIERRQKKAQEGKRG